MAYPLRFALSNCLAGGLLALALCLAPSLAAAADAPGSAKTGDDTHAWLSLQASGAEAEGEARPMTGDVADAVYQRYLESFRQAIPQQLSGTAGGDAKSGSSGGPASAGAATGADSAPP